MVKKSLAKIDPNYISNFTNASGALDPFALSVNTLSQGITDVSSQIALLSGTLSDTQLRLSLMESSSGLTSVQTGALESTTLSPEDQSALDMILSLA